MIDKTDKILVTGGHGFLGKVVVRQLKAAGYTNLIVPTHDECAFPEAVDFLESAEVDMLFAEHDFDGVIHLAAVCGGIGANQANPASMFLDNLRMGTNLLATASSYIAPFVPPRFLMVGTVCSYPAEPPNIPFRPEDIWDGYPEPTNAPYGIAKRTLCEGVRILTTAGKLDGVVVYPTNLYGPGDEFDPAASHVIPALIGKMETARKHGDALVTLWGTGRATRDFLYVEDAAAGIVAAFEKAPNADPINLGSGVGISIRDLAHLVADHVGYRGAIRFDHEHPDGQRRRVLDVRRAQKLLDWESTTSLVAGLERTIAWWREQSNGRA